ncbi:histidine phosphatase family protein [Bacillus alveayuensis]|uniref:histidine phosphatase family protein n=1 Tax=Aeribacillus alveayuensis TaxID=279215 RepID=UPI0005CD5EEA|nr:histidine phosphatase family protein [Bacillus alveayuensis]
MKVGLIRHFKVTRGYPNKFVTSDELMKWADEYDASDVEENEIDLCNIEWKRCFSSDLLRAKITAEKAFNGKIVYLEELREIKLSPFFRLNIRLPLFLHLFFIRVAWLFNHKSQLESKSDVIKRINAALDKILISNEDVLIVSHGGIMMFMRKELMRRGFKGPKFRRPDHGKLYIFQKL